MSENKHCVLQCRYFWSCVIYVLYAFGFVLINIKADVWSLRSINQMYVWLGVVHVFNAQQFAWVTLQDYKWDEMWLVPDYLNVIGSALYMWSATLYKDESLLDSGSGSRGGHKFGQYNESYYVIRNLELAASVIEVFAAIGWVVAWYASYSNIFYPEERFVQLWCQPIRYSSVSCAAGGSGSNGEKFPYATLHSPPSPPGSPTGIGRSSLRMSAFEPSRVPRAETHLQNNPMRGGGPAKAAHPSSSRCPLPTMRRPAREWPRRLDTALGCDPAVAAAVTRCPRLRKRSKCCRWVLLPWGV